VASPGTFGYTLVYLIEKIQTSMVLQGTLRAKMKALGDEDVKMFILLLSLLARSL
jgi:hypothetical protein